MATAIIGNYLSLPPALCFIIKQSMRCCAETDVFSAFAKSSTPVLGVSAAQLP